MGSRKVIAGGELYVFKTMNSCQKGFIPILILAIISILTASVGAGVVLERQGRLPDFMANVAGVFQGWEEKTVEQPVSPQEDRQQEQKRETPEPKQQGERISKSEEDEEKTERARQAAEEARLEAEKLQHKAEEARLQAEQELRRQEEAQRIAEEERRQDRVRQETQRQAALREVENKLSGLARTMNDYADKMVAIQDQTLAETARFNRECGSWIAACTRDYLDMLDYLKTKYQALKNEWNKLDREYQQYDLLRLQLLGQ